MKQEIKYQGYTAQPSDYECQDGDLADSLNLIHEDGSLKPIFQPKPVLQLEPAEKIKFIHATPVFKHYIILHAGGNTLWWIDERDEEATRHAIEVDQTFNVVHKINSVGNTLCVLCDNGLHYILWKPNDEAYLYLGTKPEMLQLSFGLSDNKMSHYNDDEPGVYNDGSRQLPYPGETVSNYAHYNMHHNRARYLNLPEGHASVLKYDVKSEWVDELNDAIWALINKTNDHIAREGHFYAPFFVRYCYRMYDDKMWMHSAPVFMPVSMPYSYVVNCVNYNSYFDTQSQATLLHESECVGLTDDNDGYDPYKAMEFVYFPRNVALTCKLVEGNVSELLSKWGDIIKSVDIFVSLPLTREDMTEKIKSVSVGDKQTYNLRNYNLSKQNYLTEWTWRGEDGTPVYPYLHPYNDPVPERGRHNWFYFPYRIDDVDYSQGADWYHYTNNFLFDIPLISEEAYNDKIHNTANFYRIKSIDLENFSDEINSTRYSDLDINKSVLPVLATQEVMTDDYKSHNTILPLIDDNNRCVTSIYNYNQRENIAAMRESLFSGFPAIALTPFCRTYDGEEAEENRDFRILQLDVVIRTEEGDKEVLVQTPGEINVNGKIARPILYNCPLFYPDSRAVRFELYARNTEREGSTNTVIYKYTIKLKPHPMLNGAVSEGGVMATLEGFYPRDLLPVTPPIRTLSASVQIPYKIYTSEVLNPFLFPSTGINTVGTGSIIGLCAATKALSQGQFGQFPLYAFTTEGVWALSISDTGTVSAAHTVTRDVVLNADSITQLDSSVVFATSRGIMHIVGSEATCISDFLNSPDPFDFTNLPAAEQLQTINPQITPIAPFLDFLAESRMAYDYLHQRIILFNPSIEHGPGTLIYPYAYVFSLKSKLWGTMRSNLIYTINSYPDAMAVNHDNSLVTFSDTDETISNGFALTRPIKLGDGNTLKSIHTLMQRGYFSRGDVYTVLYGSRDLMTWHVIASSRDHAIHNVRGTAYKYFRIAAFTNFTKEKSLSGASVVFEPRHLNVLH
jgi:hypothetical protein